MRLKIVLLVCGVDFGSPFFMLGTRMGDGRTVLQGGTNQSAKNRMTPCRLSCRRPNLQEKFGKVKYSFYLYIVNQNTDTMKHIYLKGFLLMVLGIVLCIIETWYFGWNMTPQSMSEQYCDIFCGSLVLSGFLMLFFSNNKNNIW